VRNNYTQARNDSRPDCVPFVRVQAGAEVPDAVIPAGHSARERDMGERRAVGGRRRQRRTDRGQAATLTADRNVWLTTAWLWRCQGTATPLDATRVRRTDSDGMQLPSPSTFAWSVYIWYAALRSKPFSYRGLAPHKFTPMSAYGDTRKRFADAHDCERYGDTTRKLDSVRQGGPSLRLDIADRLAVYFGLELTPTKGKDR